MVESTSFGTWARDCPMKDGNRCVTTNRACRRYRCPRIEIYKSWRINEKERFRGKKWWT